MILAMDDGTKEEVTVTYSNQIKWRGEVVGTMERGGKRDWTAKRGMRFFKSTTKTGAAFLLIKHLKEMGA